MEFNNRELSDGVFDVPTPLQVIYLNTITNPALDTEEKKKIAG